MILGLSTGTLRNSFEIRDILNFYKQIGCKAVEISQNHLLEVDKSMVSDFGYVSTHARTDLLYQDNEDSHSELKKLESKHNEIGFKCVVIHPDRVKDWSIFSSYKIPWAIENMDNRNSIGKTQEEIHKLIIQTDFNAVIDLNHCFTNDKTMKNANEFYEILKDKIVELHISGYRDSTDEGRHIPLYETKQNEILNAVKNIPTIIEIDSGTKESIEKEFNFVKQKLETSLK